MDVVCGYRGIEEHNRRNEGDAHYDLTFTSKSTGQNPDAMLLTGTKVKRVTSFRNQRFARGSTSSTSYGYLGSVSLPDQ